ncbi:hypothetical protein EVAR_79659_1 [Eumeta japonica]|uniref:Uncharacterized protein n=1 Tax=Eumeta variegata TaxID=151549 RepID=A0A4C1WAB6_EUMVA|nr:hypothetical protein EVAR_79659_1 [Eumeta japonica]
MEEEWTTGSLTHWMQQWKLLLDRLRASFLDWKVLGAFLITGELTDEISAKVGLNHTLRASVSELSCRPRTSPSH